MNLDVTVQRNLDKQYISLMPGTALLMAWTPVRALVAPCRRPALKLRLFEGWWCELIIFCF
jgi:hypothetical protein